MCQVLTYMVSQPACPQFCVVFLDLLEHELAAYVVWSGSFNLNLIIALTSAYNRLHCQLHMLLHVQVQTHDSSPVALTFISCAASAQQYFQLCLQQTT